MLTDRPAWGVGRSYARPVPEIIEVQSGSYLGEDDIVQFEDVYNRVDQPLRMD